MCGRFIVLSENDQGHMQSIFEEINRRYPGSPECALGDVYPAQSPAVITAGGPRPMVWGFPRKSGGVVINARSETLHTNPFFRDSFDSRRCLIPAGGFYEWQQASGRKLRHLIRLADATLYMAGVYRPFTSLKERGGYGFVVVTAPAWPEMAAIHGRMPVLLTGDAPRLWLASETPRPELLRLLSPAPLPLIITPQGA